MIGVAQLRGLAWAATAVFACALLFALSLHVNALKSKVRQAELQIVSLKHEKVYLETEFETRANQQQLEAWNDVDFGYIAPGPGQFVEDDRQLAGLGKLPQLPAPAAPQTVAATHRSAAAAGPIRLAQRTPAPVSAAKPPAKPSSVAAAPAKLASKRPAPDTRQASEGAKLAFADESRAPVGLEMRSARTARAASAMSGDAKDAGQSKEGRRR